MYTCLIRFSAITLWLNVLNFANYHSFFCSSTYKCFFYGSFIFVMQSAFMIQVEVHGKNAYRLFRLVQSMVLYTKCNFFLLTVLNTYELRVR